MTDILADIDKKYHCVSATQVHMKNVTVTLYDTTIQAYLSNSTFSKGGETLPHCCDHGAWLVCQHLAYCAGGVHSQQKSGIGR